MTRDEHSSRRAEAQRVADALGDLFDGVAPSNRAAAEEELRDVGTDPNRVAQRTAATATAVLAGADAGAKGGRRGAQRQVGGARQRGPSGERDSRHSQVASAFVRVAAVLLVGIAIGWIVGRASAPAPEPQIQVVRSLNKPASERQQAVVAERPPGRVDSSKTSASAAAAPPQTDEPSEAAGADASAARAEAPQDVDRQEENQDQVLAPSHPQEGDVTAGEEDATEGAEEVALAAGGSNEPWVLEQSNWMRGRDLLPPQVLQHVQTGDYWFTVQPIAPAILQEGYSERFQYQSAQNAGRYDVDPTSCGLREVDSGQTPSFYFGFPFASVRKNDRSAGCKIMWNAAAASAVGGGQVSSIVSDQFTDSSRSPERRFELTFSSTPFLGRDSGRIANPGMLRSASMLQVNAPFDLKGTAVLTRRRNDPGARDDVWMYIPALRRVRRLSPAQRSESLFGSDLSLDKFECFDGKIEDFTWRLVGRQTMLVPLVGAEPSIQSAISQVATVPMPSMRAAFEIEGSRGAPWLVIESLTMTPRPVWIVEGAPRDKSYLVGKLVLYVDQDLFRTYWRLDYSWQGEYFGHTMCAQHWSRTADGTLATATASALIGVTQPREATRHGILSRSTEQSFTQERGDEFFTLSTAIQAAH